LNNLLHFCLVCIILLSYKIRATFYRSLQKRHISLLNALLIYSIYALVNMVLNSLVYVALVIVIIIVIVLSLKFLLNAVFILPVTLEHKSLIKYVIPIHLPIWLYWIASNKTQFKLIINNRWEEFIVWMNNNNQFPTSCSCCGIMYYIL
jgi:hypothetical protein